MKTFDQLTQDEQLTAVEKMIDNIIHATLDGAPPYCLAPFAEDINKVLDSSFTSKEILLREMIEARRDMKIAVLHQAGEMAIVSHYT